MSTNTVEEELTEAERTNQTRNKGKPDGLFRACMDEIKNSHSIGQALRNAFIAAGLLTDLKSYSEMLSQFYSATQVLEERIAQAKKQTDGEYKFVQKILTTVDYNFVKGYEADLEELLGSEWKDKSEAYMTDPAKEYQERLKTAKEEELIAAIFILWGPLIIGGGPALKPKVQKAFGKDATNVFTDVIGKGRAERKTAFINAFDDLLENESLDEDKKKALFNNIVKYSGELMNLNNDMMSAVKESPGMFKRFTAAMSLVYGLFASKLIKSS